jgi:hypothetical protein
MPELCRFFGIVISMYYDDHAPPHFHAKYGSERAQFSIDPPGLIKGDLSPRAIALVMEWAALRREALLAAWQNRAAGRPPGKVEPLR